MNKTLLFLTGAAAIMAAISCNKPQDAVLPSGTASGAITINIDIPNDRPSKSAVGEMKDSQINKIQVFVFDSAGKLETDYYEAISPVATTNYNVTMATFTGAKTVYAILNHNRIALRPKVGTMSNLETMLSDLSDNSVTNLVMSGKNEITVTEYDKNKNAAAVPQTLNIYVKRLASQILVDKVTVDFTGTELEGGTFSISQIYLKNVVGKAPLGVQGLTATSNSNVLPMVLNDTYHNTADNWYNKNTYEAGCPSVIYDNASIAATSVSGTSTALGRVLFAYPNKTNADSHAESFGPRHTRLVIKAHVKKDPVDEDTYYVLDLPVLTANNIYKITDFKITMLGKSDDNKDDNLQAGRITPTITVDPWTGTTNLSYEF